MLHGITYGHSASLHPGHALRISAVAFGSVLLIAALALELYAIAVAIAS